MKPGAVVVEGPLAIRMRRLAAARSKEIGREVLTLSLLAARLAGGFARSAGQELLYPAIRQALAQGGFAELETVRELPGMTRAVAQSLASVWRADLGLNDLATGSPRLADLYLIERRIQASLPAGAFLPRDLRDAAIAQLDHASTLFPAITIEGLIEIDPVWRPLIAALARETEVTWSSPIAAPRPWFPNRITIMPKQTPAAIRSQVCADPRSEVVEALRWARELLSIGNVAASDIAITAASPVTWDDHFLALSREAGVPVHFSHGIPALGTREGQACAALADVLSKGLSQLRVRRLIRRLPSSNTSNLIPFDWSASLPRSAGLFTLEHWRRALAEARTKRASGDAVENVLFPMLELLARGPAAAVEAGDLLLAGASRTLWDEALRIAPPDAITLSLNDLRVPDGRDPGNSIVWCPASHLAGSPRPSVRLLGMTSKSWPRAERDDPLIPNHILPRRLLQPVSLPDHDREIFDVIVGQASGAIILSRSRRSGQGALQSPSGLWDDTNEESLGRSRVPQHAFSESDRLLARPKEAVKTARVDASRECWKDWSREILTAHDGAVRSLHPVIERSLDGVQSTTSIRRLLRDPLGFIWRYGLGWRSPEFEQQPLTLSPLAFGELVHELIRRTIETLEPEPGFARSSEADIDNALNKAVAAVAEAWPLERAIPPNLLWRHTLDEAARRTWRGLTVDDPIQEGTRSWVEVPFGETVPPSIGALPWDPCQEVRVVGTKVRFGGRIDRLDLRATADALRISDYKSGQAPKNAKTLVIAQGSELQRVLYAMAARQLLPEARTIVSRLVYLSGNTAPFTLTGNILDEAIEDVAGFVVTACNILRSRGAVPGPDGLDKYNDLRLALPSDREAYFQRKQRAFREVDKELSTLWDRR